MGQQKKKTVIKKSGDIQVGYLNLREDFFMTRTVKHRSSVHLSKFSRSDKIKS